MKKHIVIVIGLALATGVTSPMESYKSAGRRCLAPISQMKWQCGNPVGCQGGPRDGNGPRNGNNTETYKDNQCLRRLDDSCNTNGRGNGCGRQCGPRDGRGGGCNTNGRGNN